MDGIYKTKARGIQFGAQPRLTDEQIAELRQRLNLEIQPEDRARLSPLDHRYINFLGHYDFSLPEPLSNGQLRPLRDPFEKDRFLSA